MPFSRLLLLDQLAYGCFPFEHKGFARHKVLAVHLEEKFLNKTISIEPQDFLF